jgi:NitT/TauT family transport system permease protein
VASFVILSLIWLESEQLSGFIAYVMVLPVIYINVLGGISSRDEKMLEMAKVFGFSPLKKLLYIYTPAVIPFFKSGCSVALGLCWKAGIAAEIIAMPRETIGVEIGLAKQYLESTTVFAWTLTVVLLSLLIEFGFSALLRKLTKKFPVGGGADHAEI